MKAEQIMSELEELGFSTAKQNFKYESRLPFRLRTAFEHFRVVTPEHIKRFNNKLYEITRKDASRGYQYDRLLFTRIKDYAAIPPKEVLEKIRQAKNLACFDDFEIATIESVLVIPDPIVFGIIEGCDNKYFVAQWDNDVRIEDILATDEG
jgi:hypothetical protein